LILNSFSSSGRLRCDLIQAGFGRISGRPGAFRQLSGFHPLIGK
jgi:hypothetical protein